MVCFADFLSGVRLPAGPPAVPVLWMKFHEFRAHACAGKLSLRDSSEYGYVMKFTIGNLSLQQNIVKRWYGTVTKEHTDCGRVRSPARMTAPATQCKTPCLPASNFKRKAHQKFASPKGGHRQRPTVEILEHPLSSQENLQQCRRKRPTKMRPPLTPIETCEGEPAA
jgi:hypothetical protein